MFREELIKRSAQTGIVLNLPVVCMVTLLLEFQNKPHVDLAQTWIFANLLLFLIPHYLESTLAPT